MIRKELVKVSNKVDELETLFSGDYARLGVLELDQILDEAVGLVGTIDKSATGWDDKSGEEEMVLISSLMERAKALVIKIEGILKLRVLNR